MRNLLALATLALVAITLAVVFGNLQGIVFSVAGTILGGIRMIKG